MCVGRTLRLLEDTRNKTGSIRQLAHYLYSLCERKKWADEARMYNELIITSLFVVRHQFESSYDLGFE
jgi:putative DNA methylase